MNKDNGIVDGDAIQIDEDGKITLVLATDEPFTQDTNGLALTIDDTLDKTGGTLSISERTEARNTAEINSSQLVSAAHAESIREEARAVAFFQGNM
jgi:DNA polymerase II large subunit